MDYTQEIEEKLIGLPIVLPRNVLSSITENATQIKAIGYKYLGWFKDNTYSFVGDGGPGGRLRSSSTGRVSAARGVAARVWMPAVIWGLNSPEQIAFRIGDISPIQKAIYFHTTYPRSPTSSVPVSLNNQSLERERDADVDPRILNKIGSTPF